MIFSKKCVSMKIMTSNFHEISLKYFTKIFQTLFFSFLLSASYLNTMKPQQCSNEYCKCCRKGCDTCQFCKANLHCKCTNQKLFGLPIQPCHCPYCPDVIKAKRGRPQRILFMPIGKNRFCVR